MLEKNTKEFGASEENDEAARPSMGGFLTDLVKVIVIAVIAMLLFRYFIAEPFIVSGDSMVPTYHNHEYLVINKLGYRINKPERGEVIVFRFPQNTKEFFIKRIIGLPGEKVKVDGGHVVIYNTEHPEGKTLDEPYLPSQNITFGDSKIITLGSDEYFVLGDNRLQSSDSRLWGILPANDIVGKVFVRVFPPQEFKLITDPAYQF
jgi:signal peptidase I